MKWRIWTTWWIKFYTRYFRLFWIYIKKHGEKTIKHSIKVYINKIENAITFKIKLGYYLEFSISERLKLHGSTKSKIANNKNGENVPYPEITEVVSIHSNVVNNSYQRNSRVLYTFVPNKSLDQLLDISA